MKYLLWTLLTSATICLAKEPLEKKHQEIFTKFDHMSTDFKQVIYKKLRNRKMEREGTAHFSRPNSFRWNFNHPLLGMEEFYYDGQTLTHYQEKEAVVTHYNANIGLAKELNQVVQLVLDPTTLLNRYDIAEINEPSKQTIFKLTPRPGTATEIKQITIKVSDQKKYVEAVRIEYLDENYTHFQFKNPVFSDNKPNIFKFSRKGAFTIRSHG